jgi:4-amino-4-deoxy-L-arabinose transferase-like glycosyltransferase
MSPLLAGLLCLLASTQGPIEPYAVGSELPGGYRIDAMERTDGGAFVVTLEGDPPARVLFLRREDDVPAFTRTEHCNVVYDSNLPSGSPTPQGLGAAIQALVRAAAEDDRECLELGTTTEVRSSLMESDVSPPFPWRLALVIVLAFGLLGLAAGRISPRIPERWKEPIFWAAVVLFTVVGAVLRLHDVSTPFCESSYTQRVELAESTFWQIFTFEVMDGRHPPMVPLILRFILPLSRSEWAVRLPFVIAACLSLPLVALLGRRVEGRLTGAAACLACALLQPLVFLGHQASSHALLFALAPATLLCLHRMLEKPGWSSCLALAAANTAVFWTNYLAGLVVGPQLVLLLRPGTRSWTARALGLSTALSLLPLYRMVRGLGQDVTGHAASERAPEVIWGNFTVGQVLTDGVAMAGVPVAVALASLAAAGAVLLVYRASSARRGFSIVLAAVAWLGPLTVLALTPVARMRGRYMYDLVPLLVLLGVIGAVIGARMLAGRIAPRRTPVGDAASWAAAFLLAAMAAWPLYHAGPRALAYHEQDCRFHEVSRIIARSDVHTVAIPFGHSRTLFGYYMGGRGHRVEDRTGLESWDYSGVTVRTLYRFQEGRADWRKLAGERLERLVATGPVWLVDITPAERTWPVLERLGRCRERYAHGQLRLLLCPGLSAPVEPPGP